MGRQLMSKTSLPGFSTPPLTNEQKDPKIQSAATAELLKMQTVSLLEGQWEISPLPQLRFKDQSHLVAGW